jgi:hypothetical protein
MLHIREKYEDWAGLSRTDKVEALEKKEQDHKQYDCPTALGVPSMVDYLLVMQIVKSVTVARETLATHQVEVRNKELMAQVRTLELSAEVDRQHQQAAILTKLIDACTHIEDRKFDLIVEAFRATHGLLAEQQTALLQERKDIGKQKSDTPSSEVKKIIFFRKRETEISNELSDIRRVSSMLNLQCQIISKEASNPFSLPQLSNVW